MQVKFKYDIVRKDLEAALEMPVGKVRCEQDTERDSYRYEEAH